MTLRQRDLWLSGLALATVLLSSTSLLAQQPRAAASGDIDILTRGPIHEGFAQPLTVDPAPTPVVPQKPPEPIPEEPPDQKPKSDKAQWIPGYWNWDAEKKEYIWVSGFWRVPPPERKWVPGYWAKTADGWQWVPGYWASPSEQKPEYYPSPPESPEAGPSTPAPDENSFYTPGLWTYSDSQYLWRPGFWTPAYDGWVWHAPYYSWTPGGCILVNGYWDYPLGRRGLLFAPVCFSRPLWATAGWRYRPSYVVSLNELLNSFFVRPAGYSYYFGDYYAPSYWGAGYYPWYAYGTYRYDPLFAYYRWKNQDDAGWVNGLRQAYLNGRNGQSPALPRTFAQQTAQNGFQRVVPLSQVSGKGNQLTTVSASQLAGQQAAVQQFRNAGVQRSQMETALAGTIQPSTARSLRALQLPAASQLESGGTVQRRSFYMSAEATHASSVQGTGLGGPSRAIAPSVSSSPSRTSTPSVSSAPRSFSAPATRSGGSMGGGGGHSSGGHHGGHR
jgi:hypothetical protein